MSIARLESKDQQTPPRQDPIPTVNQQVSRLSQTQVVESELESSMGGSMARLETGPQDLAKKEERKTVVEVMNLESLAQSNDYVAQDGDENRPLTPVRT